MGAAGAGGWGREGREGGEGRERREGGGVEGGKRVPGPGPGAAQPRGRPHVRHVEAQPGCRQSPPPSPIGLCRHRSGGLSVSSLEVMLPLIGPQVVRLLCCCARPAPELMTSDWLPGM